MMTIRPLLCLLLLTSGCSKEGATEAPAPPPNQTTAPTTTAAGDQATEGTPEVKEPSTAPPAEPAASPAIDPVERFSRAMKSITTCERADDGLMVTDTKTCFEPVRAAREPLIHPPHELAPTPEAKATLLKDLGIALEDLLQHDEPTVILYALTEHKAFFSGSQETITRIERHMKTSLEPVAEAATMVRLALTTGDPEQTKTLALTTFQAHSHRRVRHAACRHLGSPQYKGNKAIFKRMLAVARDQGVDLLMRSCAAREAGHIATNRELKQLVALLDDTKIQQSVIVGLQRGLGTPEAYKAYVRWFERHATKPDKLHWTSMHVFLPWDTELDRLPRKASVKVLSRIAGHAAHTTQIRTLAIEGLQRLKATAELTKLADALAPDSPAELRQALGR